MRESQRDRRLRSFAARFGQASGRSAPCVQPKTPDGHQRGERPAPPEMYLPEACSFQLPKVCSFRLPLTTATHYVTVVGDACIVQHAKAGRRAVVMEPARYQGLLRPGVAPPTEAPRWGGCAVVSVRTVATWRISARLATGILFMTTI